MLTGDELVPFSFAWVSADTADSTYSYNATGGDINVARNSEGSYTVEFEGLVAAGEGGGHVQVTAYGSNTQCKVRQWGDRLTNTDLFADVDCYNSSGIRTDSAFVVSVIHPKSISASLPITISESYMAYAWAGRPVASSYQPAAEYTSNPWGEVNITRSGTGSYQVNFVGLGNSRLGGTVQVTGYGNDPNKCAIQSWSANEDFIANVGCTDPSGSPADAAFNIGVIPPIQFSSVGFAWANDPTGTNYNPLATYAYSPTTGDISATRTSQGNYVVTFRGLNVSGDPGGHVMATSYGDAANYCNVSRWTNGGSDNLTAVISCFDSSGLAVDSRFTILAVPEPEGDRFEPNDTQPLATDLGSGDQVVTDLSILSCGGAYEFCSVPDYYRWTATETGQVDVGITFRHADGNLDLELLDDAGNPIASSKSQTDNESISTNVVAGQVLYVRVTGPQGWTNSYDLSLETTASFENRIFHVGLSPASPAELNHGELVNLSFDYTTNVGDGVLIFARPMTGDTLSPNYSAHGSSTYLSPDGSGTGFLTISTGDVHVDRVRLQMWNLDQTELLYETFVDVDYDFAAEVQNSIFNIEVAPASPADLVVFDDVEVSFSFTSSETGGVYLWAQPFTDGSLTARWEYEASPLYLPAPGSSSVEDSDSRTLTITRGPAHVDQIRIQMWNQAQTELLAEEFVSVDIDFEPFSLEPVAPPKWFAKIGTVPAIDHLLSDFNQDYVVNFTDFLTLSANFGQSDASSSDGDTDANGKVDFTDFLNLSSEFGRTINIQQFPWRNQLVTAARGQWVVRISGEIDEQQQVSELTPEIDVQEVADRLAPLGIQVIEGLGQTGLVLLQTDAETEEAARSLFELPLAGLVISEFEPNFVMQLHDFPIDPPDDLLFASQWGLENPGDQDIDARGAWPISTGDPNVIVAVIDTGLDYNHPDILSNVWINPGETMNGIDDDGNGLVDDIRGYDFANDDNDPIDMNGHGTHVAGIVGAVGNNNTHVIGVAPNTTILPVQNCSPSCWNSDSIQAINYVTMMAEMGHNIRVINASWGGGKDIFDDGIGSAIRAAAAQNVLFVASAGNGGDDQIGDNNDVDEQSPAGFGHDNIIAVAASDINGDLAGFSNFGPETVDLSAPGVLVPSTEPTNQNGLRSGTSMAAPHVAGVAALGWAVKPGASYAEIRDAIFQGVDRLASHEGLMVTGGRVNAAKTLQLLTDSVRLHPQTFVPPHLIGDRDFFGHGPRVSVRAQVRIGDFGELQTRLWMLAEEWEDGEIADNPTVATGWSDWQTAYTPPPGRRVVSFGAPGESPLTYVDNDHELDVQFMDTTGLVQRYEIIGDTNGDESGTRTSVKAFFNRLSVVLSEPAEVEGIITTASLSSIGFVPPHVRGDAEFDGHGPRVEAQVQLRINDSGNVEARISMDATEWDEGSPRDDFTTASGISEWRTVYSAPAGKIVTQIASPSADATDYLDSDHTEDGIPGRGGLVRQWRFVGDTDGSEAGTRTRVFVDFNEIHVVLNDTSAGLERVTVPVPIQSFTPPHVRGDQEFDGNGPKITVGAQLSIVSGDVYATITMRAEEWKDGRPKDDYTTAAGTTGPRLIYSAPAGKDVARIIGPVSQTVEVLDGEPHSEIRTFPVGNLIRQITWVGDTDGPEAGIHTLVDILLRDLVVELAVEV